MTRLKRSAFKHIEDELYYYQDTLKEIDRLRNEIMFDKGPTDESGIRGGEISRPTERIATRLLTNKRLRNLEEIAEAIDKVYTELPTTHRNLVQLKYWARPQTLTWDGIAGKLYVTKRQAYRWRDETINSVGEVLGWR
jgi:RinA family phage transcriptional activator